MHILTILAVALLFMIRKAQATIWYVHPDSTLNSIQIALDYCSANDTVIVGPGVYVENIVWPTTQGIDLISEYGPDTTVIDGDSAGSVIRIVTDVNSATVINGFTIRNGYYGYGGGIYCSDCSPSIIGNTITYNTAGVGAGGIHCVDNATPTIRGNRITNNTAPMYAAGIYCVMYSSPLIDSCEISNNNGNGVHCQLWSSPMIIHNNITNNIGYGVCNTDPSVIVNAENNWWGDPSGPYHPDSNPGGSGDSVSDYVDFIPWLDQPVGVEEKPIIDLVANYESIGAIIFSGLLRLPEGKKCKVFDITGRVVMSDRIKPGIYFIEIDNKIVHKVIKIR